MSVEIVTSKGAPSPIGPYSQAIKTNGFVFTSGQIAIDAESNELIDGDVQAQAKKVFENLKAVLQAAGSSLELVVKTTIFLKDLSDFADVNAIYAQYFGKALPARSTVEVSRLPKDVLIEVDCIAVQG